MACGSCANCGEVGPFNCQEGQYCERCGYSEDVRERILECVRLSIRLNTSIYQGLADADKAPINKPPPVPDVAPYKPTDEGELC